MPPLSQRFRDLAGRAGTALLAYSRLASPAAPGLTPVSQDKARGGSSDTARALWSPEAWFGRTTYGAGPSPTRYSSYVAAGLEPQTIWSTQIQRNNGYPHLWVELLEDVIERDGHLGGVIDTRRQSVADKPFRVHSARRGDPVADTVARITERVIDKCQNFDQAVEDLLSASAYGYAISEIVWAWARVRFPLPNGNTATVMLKVPQTIEWVHWKHLRFDRNTDEPYLWLQSGGEQPIPPHKFVFHAASGTGLVERRGFMGSCVWLSAAKRWSERDWLVYAKLFGIPQILAQYPEGTEEYDKHRTKYVQFLKDWGEGIPALLPDDLKVNISREPAGRSNDLHGAIIGWANAEISKRVLGSTLTVEMGGQGSWAAADTHRDAPYMRSRADAKKLAGTLRRDLLTSIIEVNLQEIATATGFSPDSLLESAARCSWRIEKEMSPRDRQAIIEGAVNELGCEVDEEQYRDEMGLDAPPRGGKALRGKLQPIASGGGVVPTVPAAQADEPIVIPKDDASPAAEERVPPPVGDGSDSPVTPPASESLNGAQVTALMDVIRAVTAGEMPKEVARQIIATAFPIPPEQVAKMLDPVEVKAAAPPTA
jgi:hypothetical protein